MASIPGSVRVGGFIAPSDTTDTYATHDSLYGRGGHKEVASTVERDAIPADRRREGMLVFVAADGKNYQLIGGVANANWQELPSGGSGGVTDHGALTGLSDDDHAQYLNETRHDLLDHTGLTGIPSIAGLLDETAHDLLDHSGLAGIPAPYTLPTASTTVLGGVKVDGTTVTITDGVISSTATGGVTAHNNLTNLDYASAGHTGFQETLVSGTNIKTINGSSVLGGGDLTISGSSHDPVSVSDSTSIDLTLTGQALTASAIFGTTSGTVAEGSHNHSGIYQPVMGTDDNYVTDAEKADLHSHSNKTALDAVSGTNTGDQDLSGYAVTSSLATVATTGSYTDLSNTPSIPTQYTDEMAQDAVGAAIAAGTQSGISVTYDDTNNKFDFTVTAAGAGDVAGPSSSTNNNIAVFDGITGKVIKDGGVALSGLAASDHNHTGTYAPATHASQHYPEGTDPVNAKCWHGIVSRSTVAPLPTHITTNTFTISASTTPITYYNNSVKCVVATDKSVTLTGGAGFYYIMFSDAAGTLEAFTSFPGLAASTGKVFLATVWWNGSNYGLVNDERHSFDRDTAWHTWAHHTVGCRWFSGIDILTLTGTGAAATMTLNAGNIRDEDISFNVPASADFATPNAYRIFYQTGVQSYTFVNALSTIPFSAGANNRPNYVHHTTYALTQAPSANNRFINQYVYATTDPLCPIYICPELAPVSSGGNNYVNDGGHRTIALARSMPWPNLTGIPISAEMKPLYRIIVRADGVVQATAPEDDYRNVSNLPQSAGTSSTIASNVGFSPVGNVAAINVQAAIEELDSEKAAADHNHSALYQPLDQQLTDLAGLSYTGNGGKVIAVTSGADGFELVTPSSGGGGGGGMVNPMTTAGDIIVGGTDGSAVRLAKGTDGQVLTLASGMPTWSATSGGSGSMPTGSIVRSGGAAPTGCIACDGSLLPTAEYADLYSVIGDLYSYQMNNGQPWKQQWLLNYTQTTDIQPWSTGTSLPGALAHSQAIVTNSRVYLLGGSTTVAVATVYTAPINSDGTLGTWSTAESLPVATAYAQAIMTNNRVYLLGGSAGSVVQTAPINSDGTLGTWSLDTSLPGGANGFQAVVTNSRVYVIGSATYTAPINPDGTLGTWSTDVSLPAPVVYSQAIVTNGRVYLLGGYTSAYISTVYTAPINPDGTLGTWTTGTSLPVTLGYSQAVVTNGRVYLFGGVANGAIASTVYTAPINADGTLGTWATGTSLPAVGYVRQAITTNSRIYLLGGFHSAALSTVYVAAFSGGYNNYLDKSYITSAGTGQFRVPDTRWNDLRTPMLNSYIKV